MVIVGFDTLRPVVAGLLAAAAAFATASEAAAQSCVTFTKDIAPIIFEFRL